MSTSSSQAAFAPKARKVNAFEGVVEAWSTTRLQFEPKAWQREFRAQLRTAIATLTGGRQPLTA